MKNFIIDTRMAYSYYIYAPKIYAMPLSNLVLFYRFQKMYWK